jgi:hypothetical protein
MSETKEPDLPMVRVDNPFPLLDKMIERGTDPVALGQMMALAERWREARAKEEFAVAMRTCQEEMPVVVKDAQNKHTNSRYARLEEVNKVIKPAYTKHGFSVSFGELQDAPEGMVRILADVRHSGGHSAPYRVDMPLDGVGSQGKANAMNPVQARGSTISYAKRYLLCMIFNVTIADEDTDGNADDDDPQLTQSQIDTIAALLGELGGLDKGFKLHGFNKFMLDAESDDLGGRSWQQSTNSHYGPAMEMLSLKIAKAKKVGAK